MAAKKPFRLRSVLRYKQQVEERLQGELLRLTQALAEAEAVHLQQQAQHTHCLHALRQREHIGVSAAELLTYSAFLERLSGEISQQTQVIANLHVEVQQARQRLEQAMRDRQAIEKLQERARITQNQQLRKDEERTMAEIALRRFTA
jgi:flagellar export protein FliJ